MSFLQKNSQMTHLLLNVVHNLFYGMVEKTECGLRSLSLNCFPRRGGDF